MWNNGKSWNLPVYTLLTLGAILMVFPFFWMISTSLKTGGAVQQVPPQFLPDPFVWSNYKEVWIKVDFLRNTMNSLFIVTLQVIFTLLSCSMVAFSLALFNYKGKRLLYLMMLSTMMMPFYVTMIPRYLIWKEVNMLNTFYPLILPTLLGGAFGIFLIHQYIKGLPIELYEAAIVDGYNPWGIFWKIYFPLCSPALAALGVFTFMDSWGNTIEPLLYLKDKELYTLSLALLYLRGETFGKMQLVMAGATIAMIPVTFVFLFAQKYFVQGIASTGVKA